jgi:hypothetical protein
MSRRVTLVLQVLVVRKPSERLLLTRVIPYRRPRLYISLAVDHRHAGVHTMNLLADLLYKFIVMGGTRYLNDEYVFKEMHLHLDWSMRIASGGICTGNAFSNVCERDGRNVPIPPSDDSLEPNGVIGEELFGE